MHNTYYNFIMQIYIYLINIQIFIIKHMFVLPDTLYIGKFWFCGNLNRFKSMDYNSNNFN